MALRRQMVAGHPLQSIVSLREGRDSRILDRAGRSLHVRFLPGVLDSPKLESVGLSVSPNKDVSRRTDDGLRAFSSRGCRQCHT